MIADYKGTGEILKALGHPLRLQIVEGLLHQECYVDKIAKHFGMAQSTISQHLAVLRNRKILEVRKEGVRTCYRIADERIRELITILGK